MMDFGHLLMRHLEGHCKLGPTQVSQLKYHYELLQLWNRRLNLTSLRDLEEVVVRHYCESVLLGSQLPADSVTIADVGSGAGFPGYPIAVLRPDCNVALVESNSRKCVFLREVTRGVSNVRVIEGRAEDLTEGFDWLVARALRWKDILATGRRLAAHLGLLVGESDAAQICGVRGIDWQPAIRLPWGDRRVILIGNVPHET